MNKEALVNATIEAILNENKKPLTEVGEFLLDYNKDDVFDISEDDLKVSDYKADDSKSSFQVKVDYPKIDNFYTYVVLTVTDSGKLKAKLYNKDNVDYGDNLQNLLYNKASFVNKAYEHLKDIGVLPDSVSEPSKETTQKTTSNNQDNKQIKTGANPKIQQRKDAEKAKNKTISQADVRKADIPKSGVKVNKNIVDYLNNGRNIILDKDSIKITGFKVIDNNILSIRFGYDDTRTAMPVFDTNISFIVDVKRADNGEYEVRFPERNTADFETYSDIIKYNQNIIYKVIIDFCKEYKVFVKQGNHYVVSNEVMKQITKQ